MTLEAGTRLGSYEIVAQIGAGGMGEVYRARDTTLDRDVALKVLPADLALDRERLARFEREAKALASLNHPNIATIHGFAVDGDTHFLVMELVDGDDLSDRIRRGPLPVDEAIPLFVQLAAGLEAAHDKGILHRDLKPSNIKVRGDGGIKVLDFGLAKALEGSPRAKDSSLSQSPTLTVEATGRGEILGTTAYMSPEQAQGEILDQRTDMWSLGCVFFETLTGERAFPGSSVLEISAAVLRTEPDLDRLPDSCPEQLRKLIAWCLTKKKANRLRSAADIRIQLSAISLDEPRAADSTPSSPGRLRQVAALVFVALLTGSLGWLVKPSPERDGLPHRRYKIPVGDSGTSLMHSISADGKRVAYVSDNRIFVRDLDQLSSREVADTEGANGPFWSTDAQWLAFEKELRLQRIPLGSGRPSTITGAHVDFGEFSRGVWNDNDTIVFNSGFGGLYEVTARGGDPALLLGVGAGESDFHDVTALPDGLGYVFVVHDYNAPYFDTIDLFTSGERRNVVELRGEILVGPVYSPTGHIVFERSLGWSGGPAIPGVWAIEFSLERLEPVGAPFLVAERGQRPSVSQDGTLVYQHPGWGPTAQMAWLDRAGQVLETVGEPQRYVPLPAVSVQGDQVAVLVDGEVERYLLLVDLVTGRQRELAYGEPLAFRPAFSRDGSRVYVTVGSDDQTIVARSVDGQGAVSKITAGTWPHQSRASDQLFHGGESGSWEFYTRDPATGTSSLLVEDDVNAQQVQLSPDGRLIAFHVERRDSGRFQVYVRRYPGGVNDHPVSVEGGRHPRWAKDGRELFFVDGDRVMAARIQVDPKLEISPPEFLFERPANGLELPARFPDGFEVSPDGERILVFLGLDENGELSDTVSGGLIVEQNWIERFVDP